MNEVTEKLVTAGEAAFTKALEYVEATEHFVAEQAPMLVQEILNYGLFYSGFWCVFWALMFGGVIYSAVKLYRWFKKEDEDPFFAVMLGILGGSGTFAGFSIWLFTVAKILFAPRLYLLEQLRYLL